MTYDEIIEQLEITKSKIKEIARNEYGGESWNDDLDALTEAADIVADYSRATAQASEMSQKYEQPAMAVRRRTGRLYTCPLCGKRIPVGHTHCHWCGKKHTKYVLKLDVRKCYPTMNHEELRKKLQRRIKDKKFLRLADRIIASFQQPMATHERLLPETDAVGIPVGLFTSPWFCNFFFQDIDHKVAEKTGAAHNVRYVDDMVLFDSSKRRLHKALEFIKAEVKATKQTVKDNWQVFILSKRPLDFLGFKFHPNKTTIRKSIMLRISRKARTIARAAYASIRNAHAMVSYIGYIVNSDSQRFYEKWVRPFVNIKHLKGVIADEDRKQHQACVAV